MIVGEIRRYLRDNTSLRISRSLRDTAYKALTAKEKLINQNAKEPTLEEIAAEIGASREEISAALDAIMDPVSLYEPVYHDGGDAVFVMDQVKDDKNLDELWLREISIKEAMKHLNSREQNILRMRFFMGRTQMEIANEIGISQAQVSRLEKNALGHMKKYLV